MKSRLSSLFVLITCVLHSACQHPTELKEPAQTTDTPMKSNLMKDWKSMRFVTLSEASNDTHQCEGLSVKIERTGLPPGKDLQWPQLEICAFLTKPSHLPWLGAPQDIYLAEPKAVTGVRLRPGHGIQFTPSLVKGDGERSETLASLKLHAEGQLDYKAAVGLYTGSDPKTGVNVSTVIDLRDVFKRSLFRISGSSLRPEEWQRIVSYKIVDDSLQIDLDRVGNMDTGSVWIRLTDKNLLRAVENGDQVFPRETK